MDAGVFGRRLGVADCTVEERCVAWDPILYRIHLPGHGIQMPAGQKSELSGLRLTQLRAPKTNQHKDPTFGLQGRRQAGKPEKSICSIV